MLNKDQENALSKLKKWWASPEQYMVLNAPAGYGKTFLVDSMLKSIDADVILLAPTHEALAQLKEKVEGTKTSMTIHAALGIRPTHKEGSVEFKEGVPHSIWGEVNLAIIDEASMIDINLIRKLYSLGKKILFVGHDAQLPPVTQGKSILTEAVSPIFNEGHPTITLTIPMRNSGELHSYLVRLESFAKDSERDIKGIFDVTKKDMMEYIESDKGKLDFLDGKATIIGWQNSTIRTTNTKIRKSIFNTDDKYIIGDRVLLTSPLNVIESFPPSGKIAAVLKEVNKGESLHTNTPGMVKNVRNRDVVILDKHIRCKFLIVETAIGIIPMYEANEIDLGELATLLEQRAWSYHNNKDRIKAYGERYSILSCFAKLQHSYCCTAHRVQGRTIDNVIVLVSDIRRNPWLSESKKCWYTAASRASKQLMIYKGL